MSLMKFIFIPYLKDTLLIFANLLLGCPNVNFGPMTTRQPFSPDFYHSCCENDLKVTGSFVAS